MSKWPAAEAHQSGGAFSIVSLSKQTLPTWNHMRNQMNIIYKQNNILVQYQRCIFQLNIHKHWDIHFLQQLSMESNHWLVLKQLIWLLLLVYDQDKPEQWNVNKYVIISGVKRHLYFLNGHDSFTFIFLNLPSLAAL